MATLYKDFLKKANAGAKQNRTKRVVSRTKPYGKGLGKSHEQYIAGDIVSSATNRAWGNRKNGNTPINQFTGGQDPYLYSKQQKGENPYEFKYVYTGKPTLVKGGTNKDGKKYKSFYSKNRMATDEEKEYYKNTGRLDYDKERIEKENAKTKYSLFTSHNKDAKTFREHYNTGVFDGMEVAKNRVKAGKSKFNYLTGFLKDIVADPVMDVLRTADMGESALLGGAMGLAETGFSIIDKLNGKGNKVNYGQAVDNFKSSIKSSNETGWGKSAIEYLNESNKRTDENTYNWLLRTEGKKRAEEFKKYTEDSAKKVGGLNTGLGLALDVGNPINLATKGFKVGKKLATNTATSFKDMVRGTGDLSVGILPKEQRMANQRRFLENNKKWKDFEDSNRVVDDFDNEVLEAFSNGKHVNDYKIYDDDVRKGIHELDKSYDVAMSKKEPPVMKEIASNPKTQNIAKFVNKIDEVSEVDVNKAYQEFLNKEYYPNLRRNGGRFDETDAYNKFYNSDYSRYQPLTGRYTPFREKLKSSLSPETSYKASPEIEKLFPNSNLKNDSFIPRVKDSNIKYNLKQGDTPLKHFKKPNRAELEIPKRGLTDEADIHGLSNARDKHGLYNVYKIDTDVYKGDNVDTRLFKYETLMDKLDDAKTDELFDYIQKTDPEAYERIMKRSDIIDVNVKTQIDADKQALKRIKQEGITKDEFAKQEIPEVNSKYDIYKTSEYQEKISKVDKLNSKLGDVYKQKELKSYSERYQSFYHKIDKIARGKESFKFSTNNLNKIFEDFKGKDIPVKVKRDYINKVLFNGERIIGEGAGHNNLNTLIENLVEIAKLRESGIKSSKTEIGKIVKKMQNFAGNLLDERNGAKYSYLAHKYEYDTIDKLKNSILDLKNRRRDLDKLPNKTPENIEEQINLNKQIKELSEKLSKRDAEWKEIRALDEKEFDDYLFSNHPEIGNNMDFYKKLYKRNYYKSLEDTKGYDEALKDIGNEVDRSKFVDNIEYARSKNNPNPGKVKRDPENQYAVADWEVKKQFEPENAVEEHWIKKEIDDKIIAETRLEKADEMYKEFNIPKPRSKSPKVTISKGQKLNQIPDVLENSKGLRKTIEAEMEMMYKNPSKYEVRKEIFTDMKKDFVKAMRSYGVKDEAYFDKVKKVQEDLKEYYKGLEEFNKSKKEVKKTPLDKLSKDSGEGGQGTPKLGMNLQLLAKRINKNLDDLDKTIDEGFIPIEDFVKENVPKVAEQPVKKPRKTRSDKGKPRKRKETPLDNVSTNGKQIENKSKTNPEPIKKRIPINQILNDIRKKFDSSDLDENTIDTIMDSKKKKILRDKKFAKLDNPLNKNFKLKDGELPVSSAKRLDNGNVVDKTSGEIKYSKSNKKTLNDIKADNKYFYKNKEEDEVIKQFLFNPNPKSEHFLALFDKMHIKYDITDEKSMEKAFKRFDYIIEKKKKSGVFDEVIHLDDASNTRVTIPHDLVTKAENSKLEELVDLMKESEKHGDTAMAEFYKRKIFDRGTDEILNDIMRTRDKNEKQKLYERLMQQSEYVYSEKGKSGLNYQQEKIDWLMNEGGLEVWEKNKIIDFMKREQTKLAQKGINPNAIENKEIRKKMRRGGHNGRVVKDLKITQKNIDINKTVKETQNIPHQSVLDKMSNNIIKESEHLEKPFIESAQKEKKYLELVDEIKQASTRSEKQALYERLMQQSEYAYDPNNNLKYYEEMSDWLMNEGGLSVLEKNKIVNYMKKEQLKLANKGIDPNVVENKEMRKRMRTQQYSHQTNKDYEKAEAVKSDLEKILEKEKNRKTNPTILDKILKDSEDSIVDQIKSGKPKKRIAVKEAERDVARKLEIDKEIDEKTKTVLANRKRSDGTTSEVKEISKTEHAKPNKPRTDEDMLNKELSEKEIEKSLEKDADELAKEIKDEKSLFNKFKKAFEKNNPKMPYEDSKLYHVYKSWLNSWKKGLTVYNPGWHVQNFLQNKGQNYLAFGSEAFAPQTNAKNILNYIQGGKNKVEDVVNKKTGRVYTADELKNLIDKHKVVNSHGNEIRQSRGVIPPLETKIDNSGFMKKLGHSEDTSRINHFIKQLERGMSPEDAAKSVNKYLFDYENKSAFDKVMSDFVDPFWVFHKNYARLLGQSAIENPSAIGKILRAERGLESNINEEDRTHTNEEYNYFQSPYHSYKDSKNGKTYDYLYKQNIMPRLQEALPSSQDELENKLNPIIRLAMQQLRGEGNFHNKIVDKKKAGWDEITKDERLLEIGLELNPLLNSVPTTYKRIKDHKSYADKGFQSQETTNKQVLHDWLKYITGNKANYYKRR